jgi:hypothetical protein
MWPLFLIGGVVIVGGWLWGASKVASNAPPLAAPDTFTTSAKIQVGDIVTVALVSAEPTGTETAIDLPPGTVVPEPKVTPADEVTLAALDKTASSGGTGDFQVTATGLLAPGGSAKGQPISIGILVNPPISFRFPLGFLDASVRSVMRNGRKVG